MNDREKKAIKTIDKWFTEISTTNDNNVKQTDNLKTVLVNLQIEDAHIEENTGIVPIANEIEKVIQNIHDNTDDLRKTGRKELREAWQLIKEYIEYEEDKEDSNM